jgi:hypothetical protein
LKRLDGLFVLLIVEKDLALLKVLLALESLGLRDLKLLHVVVRGSET